MIFSRSFVQYTKELAKSIYDPLTREEERDLLIQLGSGSQTALNKLIQAHLRFVVYIVDRDYKVPSHIDRMDLVQEGNLGLTDALSRFNLNCYENRIASYAQYYIRWYINRALGIYDKDIIEHNLSEDFDFDSIVIESDPYVQEKVYQDILSYIKTFLSSLEAKIISLLFGLEYPFKPLTLRDVSLLVHFSGERIRQIKEDCLERIKNHQKEINLLK